MQALETDRLVPKKTSAGGAGKPMSTGMKLVASLKVVMVLAAAIFVAVLYLRADMPSKAMKLERGSKINIMSLGYQAYIGTSNDKVVISDSTPRVHSSTFEIFHSGTDCIRLRNLEGKWLRWDHPTNTVKADSTIANQATQFEFVRQGSVTDQSLFDKNEYVQMKVCRQSLWWEVRTTATADSLDTFLEIFIVAQDPSKRNFNTRKLTTNRRKSHVSKKVPANSVQAENADTSVNQDHHGRELSKDLSSGDPSTSSHSKQPQLSPQSQQPQQAQQHYGESGLFRIEVVEPIRGVNLGGSFIPEIWMNPSFSNYTGLHWAGSLCK